MRMGREANGNGRLAKLRYLTDFSHFDAGQGRDLALSLGAWSAEIGYPEPADDWFAVAAAIAQDKKPPNQILEARVSKACRSLAAALVAHADAVDAATELQAKNVERAKENATAGKQPRSYGSAKGVE
jgi:hypothetical protein